ncbi:TCR/Tet family MFS transporter [Xinfangfangia sp. CPCC 101601]|uniref:TCR/Tet family MFS transporter n=1 Tax=Pseudogemmobacter lacusdianii TaxID=3069608 RepID=A0ABU0VY56_9RHOB|nr:TCR/Tet family MFS transporter [Xinfangfangia sp. CPCC 101601]MDQ2066682.1 TCR/Tet family MFS transporter [Xinfangfangia sp. CPCC 101601]
MNTSAETPAASDQTPAAARHAVIFVLVTVFLDMVGFGIIMPVLPKLIEDVGHVGIGEAAWIGGWMFAAFSLAQFAFAPLMGNLSDRYGRRPLLLLAIFGLGLDFILMAWAPNLVWLFIGRVIAGICGSSWIIASAYIADVTAPEERARAFGLMGAAFGVGFIIGPAIGGLLGGFGARVPFWVAAAISLANFAYGWFVLRESLPLESRRKFEWMRANPFGAFKVFSTYRGVLPLCLLMGVYFFGTAVYPAVWSFWGIAKFGWSEQMVGLTLAAFGLVSAVCQAFLTGPVTKRFGEYNTILFGLAASVLVVAGYGWLATGVVAVLILTLLHGPEGFVHPILTAILTRRVPEDAQGELQGGISAITNIAMLLGTLFFALLFAHFMDEGRVVQNPDIAYRTAAFILAAIWVWLFVLIRHERRIEAAGGRPE